MSRVRFSLKLVPTSLLSFLAANLAQGATIHVPDDLATIQDAIDAASDGDTVVVRPGTYVENIDFSGKEILLRSDDGPAETVIDGGAPEDPNRGSVVTFDSGEQTGAILDSFTLTGGTGNLHSWFRGGGGVFCLDSSPTIRGNVVAGNFCEHVGGGILCFEGSSPNITGNVISDNISNMNAGGIHCGGWYTSPAPRIHGNRITGNAAPNGSGGGISCADCSPVISRNTISGNSAKFGGGISCYEASPDLTGNVISENSAVYNGGGIRCTLFSSPTISGNVIASNVCDGFFGGLGGGMDCADGSPSIVNNIFAGNTGRWGGAMRFDSCSSPEIVNTTVAMNVATQGGGIYAKGTELTITNSIFYGDQAAGGPEMMLLEGEGPPTPTRLHISYSDVGGGQTSIYVGWDCVLNWGDGMITANPLFADPPAGDFHLTWDSPCKDAGYSSAPRLPGVDFEGDPRIAGAAALSTGRNLDGRDREDSLRADVEPITGGSPGSLEPPGVNGVIDAAVDIGADEFHLHLYFVGEAVPGEMVEIGVVDRPGRDPVALGLGSGMQDQPQPTPYGDLYLELPLLLEWELGVVPDDGVLKVAAEVPASWSAGEEYPFQVLAGPMGDWASELTNLLVVDVE
ncbi:MAG: hypothetical protein CME06_13190 [Gemmatimonadetes bacterium]|nr:hypothetical protein [Gemmatimonadota bacterium]